LERYIKATHHIAGSMKEFTLLEGEKVIKEIKPLPSLRNYFFFGGVFIILLAVYSWVWVFPVISYSKGSPLAFQISIFLIPISFVAFVFLFAILSSKQYQKQQYWITNSRVIYKRGIFGYRISSIPLERISDIIISRTLFERIFGFGSLHIQTLAGQITPSGSGMGAEGQLLAIPDPEKTQNVILSLIKQKRKKEGLTM
jgi:uncharacterized membrane protein YdbT with pleckstrin-like domain